MATIKTLIGNVKGPKGATGTRGSRWNCGTGITGTSTTETVFSGSGIADALVNDMYLNSSNGNVYRCTMAGAASAAKWVYAGSIKGTTGAVGPQGPKGETGSISDVENTTLTFTPATTRANIASGESFKTLFGKIAKFFADLKTVAFSGKYTDLSDKPGTMSGASASAAGSAGFVPAPPKGAQDKVLRGNATWDLIENLPTAFSQASSRTNLATGEALKTSLGKVMKWFADLANGAASSLLGNNLTANRALVSNGSGKVSVSAVSSTELGYLDGVTGNIQEQISELNSKTLQSFIPKHTVSCPCYIADGYFIFGTVPFPYANLYNLTFAFVGMNNRKTNFEGSRFTLHTPTRSGFDGYTNDGDIVYWVNSNKGDSPSCSFEVSGTLKP